MPEDRPPPPTTFVERYRAGAFEAFFERAPSDVEGALRRPSEADREGLAASLEARLEACGAPEAAFRNARRLRHPESRVVVTGQQPGLLLGPLYTLSKAMGAIALARRWDREERPVLPVFWVASQDHDMEEIDAAQLLDLDEHLHHLRAGWREGVPSGALPLEARHVDAVQRAWHAAAWPQRGGREAWRLLEETGRASRTPADWFARLLLRLLGGDGLLVLDPMDPQPAREALPVLHRELRDPRPSVEAINEAGLRLRAVGERPGLGRGADATNLFLHEAGQPRRLLRFDGRAFHPDGAPERRWSARELGAWLEREPTALTPAAGLRPVVQDTLLPTVATVVGPGELRYFAQLRGVYAHHGVSMPLVWPRPEATFVEPPVQRLLARFGTTAEAFQADPEGVRQDALLRASGHGDRFEETLRRVEAEMETLLREVEGIDPTLSGAVRRGHGYLETTVQRLRDKAAAALARRDERVTSQVGRLRAHLLPDDRPQERVLSPFTFFAKFGIEPVLRELRTLPPEGHHVLELDGSKAEPLDLQRRESA